MVAEPSVLAHRGASLIAAENTIAAFRAAVDLGADGVELDVHRSADGELIVHHDPDADGLGLLFDATFVDIRRARADIPTLAEVFAVLDGMIVNVEIKCCGWDPDPDPDHEVARRVVELIADLSGDDPGLKARVIVSSFDLGHIDAIRSLDPDLATGFLVHGHDPAGLVPICADRGHGWLHPDWGNLAARLESSVEAAHAAGVRLDPWTIDDPEVMRRFAAAGVDAIITNAPDVARAALRAE